MSDRGGPGGGGIGLPEGPTGRGAAALSGREAGGADGAAEPAIEGPGAVAAPAVPAAYVYGRRRCRCRRRGLDPGGRCRRSRGARRSGGASHTRSRGSRDGARARGRPGRCLWHWCGRRGALSGRGGCRSGRAGRRRGSGSGRARGGWCRRPRRGHPRRVADLARRLAHNEALARTRLVGDGWSIRRRPRGRAVGESRSRLGCRRRRAGAGTLVGRRAHGTRRSRRRARTRGGAARGRG